MDIIGLVRVVDNKTTDLYTRLAIVFPENFYFQLVSVLVPKFAANASKSEDDTVSYPKPILGNELVTERHSSRKECVLKVNGVRFVSGLSGMKAIEDLVKQVFAAEIKGGVIIKRPGKRGFKDDRIDFKHAEGTFFTKLAKNIANVVGRRSYLAQGSAVTARALVQDQVDELEGAGKDISFLDKWVKVDNGPIVYYVNPKCEHVDLTGVMRSIQDVIFAFFNPDKVIDQLARVPELRFVTQDHARRPYFVIGYREFVFVIKWSEFGWAFVQGISEAGRKLKIDGPDEIAKRMTSHYKKQWARRPEEFHNEAVRRTRTKFGLSE